MCSIAIFILSVVRRSVNQRDTLLTRNIAHADFTWNIESRVPFLTSNPEFYRQCFRLEVVLNMDTQSNPRRALNQRRNKKIVDSAETKETELDLLQRQRNKGAKG